MAQTIQEYLRNVIEKEWTDRNWLKGYLCLRCDPKGLLTLDNKEDGTTWCPFCGKDPLMHGPEYKPFKDPNFIKPNQLRSVAPDDAYFNNRQGF